MCPRSAATEGTRMNYYVTTDGAEVKGPYTMGQLRAMWLNGVLTTNARFAPEGGASWSPMSALEQRAPAEKTETAHGTKSRGLFIVLALFLGWLGIHNFYAGRYGAGGALFAISVVGLLMISTGIGSSILVGAWVCGIVDAIRRKTDGRGLPFCE